MNTDPYRVRWALIALVAAAVPIFAAADLLLQPVFAQGTEEYIINRVEIWGLFYRLMVIAFTVGAVLMGVLTYVIFRFRESNKKNLPRPSSMEGHH